MEQSSSKRLQVLKGRGYQRQSKDELLGPKAMGNSNTKGKPSRGKGARQKYLS